MKLLAFALFSLFAVTVVGGAISSAPAQEMEVIAGGEIEYQRHCAACHGEDAKGKGVMAKFLKIQPADLTLLAKKNSGEFPFWEVYRVIDGREAVKGHGTREMPVWGDRFLTESRGKDRYSETEVAGRILGLVFYLRHVQER